MFKKIFFILPLVFGVFVGYQFVKFVDLKANSEKKVLSGKTEEVGVDIEEDVVVAPTSTPTPTPTPTFTPTPTLTPTPTPKPNIVITFSSEQINALIERFSSQYGVDPNVLRHIAVCESGFDPLASKLYYGGLYQFSESTWNTYRTQMGESTNPDLRYNAEEAVQTAAYVISIGKTHIWPSCVP